MKTVPFILMSIFVIAVFALIFWKGCVNAIVADSSSSSVSPSSSIAEEYGGLVKRLNVESSEDDKYSNSCRLIDAWIEQYCEVKFDFVFIKRKRFIDKYALVFRFDNNFTAHNCSFDLEQKHAGDEFEQWSDRESFVAGLTFHKMPPDVDTVFYRNDTLANRLLISLN